MKKILLVSALANSLIVAAPALAKDEGRSAGEANGADADSGDIVVRAQRRAQFAIDVPVQLSKLSGEDLVANGVKTLSDIGDRIPNTYFGSNAGYGTPAFSIRGVGGTLSTGGEEPVAIFFDDQFIPRTLPSALLDVESVEVLRGPQVSLYGRNATAGAILLRSARPDLSAVKGHFRAQIASFETREIEGALSVPVSGAFAVRAAGLYSHSDGWATNTVNGARLNRNEVRRGRLSFLYNPSSDFEFYGNIEYGKADFAVARAGLADRRIGNRALVSEKILDTFRNGRFANDAPTGNSIEDVRATLSASWKFGGVDLTAASGYYFTRLSGTTDSDGSDQAILANSGRLRSHTFTQDLRLVSTATGPFQWIVGFSAVEDRYEMPLFSIRNFPINRDTRFRGRVPATAYAAYGEATYKLSDELSLTFGGRYTYEKKRANLSVQGFNIATGAPIAAAAGFRDGKNWEAFKPRAILQYEATDDLSLYASASTGFKSGGFNVFALAAPFDDENIIAYEAGIKGRTFDRLLTFSAAAFHYDYKDLQLRLGVPAGGVIVQNAADASIDGAEAEASLNLRNGLTLFGSISALNARLDHYLTRNLAGALVDAAGARMSRSPKFSASFGGNFERPVGAGLFARFSGSMTHRSKVYFLETDQDADTFLGRSLTNIDLRMSLGRRDKSWLVSAFVKNLSDAVEVTQVELLGNFPVATFSEPRRFGVEVAARF